MKRCAQAPSIADIDALAYYTLELTRPPDGWVRLLQLTTAARSASEQLQAAGIQVRFVRSIFVPEDDACFHLYQAGSANAVREAVRRAAVAFDRIHAADPSLRVRVQEGSST